MAERKHGDHFRELLDKEIDHPDPDLLMRFHRMAQIVKDAAAECDRLGEALTVARLAIGNQIKRTNDARREDPGHHCPYRAALEGVQSSLRAHLKRMDKHDRGMA